MHPFLDGSVERATDGYFPCGICSLRLPKDKLIWAICPRKLLAFTSSGISEKHEMLSRRILAISGFRPGDEVSVWSEITLHETGEGGKRFNYRLDYVLRNKGSPPVIVEVMTCSTSGGDKAQYTDIQSTLRNAVVSVQAPNQRGAIRIDAPAVKVRQVWARMASQLILKSEATNNWGGRTIWVVQDKLVDYIRSNTALPLEELYSPQWIPGEVNMLVSDLNGPTALYAGPIRPAEASGACWMELLASPHIPKLESISLKLREKNPIATIRVPS